MGYDVRLVASPARPVTWQELVASATGQDWQVHPAEQELRLNRRGRLVARLTLHQGEASAKGPDAEALAALVRLAAAAGLRVRGDQGESYRSATETYVHPDDAGPDDGLNRPPLPRRSLLGHAPGQTLARLALLGLCIAGFALKAWLDQTR